jgi:hypothetical protein
MDINRIDLLGINLFMKFLEKLLSVRKHDKSRTIKVGEYDGSVNSHGENTYTPVETVSLVFDLTDFSTQIWTMV